MPTLLTGAQRQSESDKIYVEFVAKWYHVCTCWTVSPLRLLVICSSFMAYSGGPYTAGSSWLTGGLLT